VTAPVPLHLVRHAHAVDADKNATRPLSRRGRAQVAALARFLRHRGVFAPAEIWHSPLVRAHETATRLDRGLRLGATLRETAGLLPEDDPHRIARKIASARAPLAIVGHEPHLSALATLLVGGGTGRPWFVMKKCAVLALEGQGRAWCVRWHVSPEIFEKAPR
jgi:phosphohistidine phosphatase